MPRHRATIAIFHRRLRKRTADQIASCSFPSPAPRRRRNRARHLASPGPGLRAGLERRELRVAPLPFGWLDARRLAVTFSNLKSPRDFRFGFLQPRLSRHPLLETSTSRILGRIDILASDEITSISPYLPHLDLTAFDPSTTTAHLLASSPRLRVPRVPCKIESRGPVATPPFLYN